MGAGAWCASSMTMVWKSGTRRVSRVRRLRVCTLATTVGAVCSSRAACTTPRGGVGSTRRSLSTACWMSSSRCARIRDRPDAAGPGGQTQWFCPSRSARRAGALHPACRGGEQGRHGFVLVRPGCQPEGDGWLGHSLHACAPRVVGTRRADAVPEGLTDRCPQVCLR